MDLETIKTENRFNKQQERLEKDFGFGVTVGPMAITRNYIGKVVDMVPQFLVAHNRQEEGFINLIKELPKEVIGLCCLQSALHCLGTTSGLSSTLVQLSAALEGECFAKGLMDFDKKLAERLDRLARSRHGNLKYRKAAVRSLARKNKFVCEAWDNKQRIIAGNWALNLVLTALPEVFSLVTINNRGEKALALTEDAFNLAEEAIKQAIHAHPVFLPCLKEPTPWTDWSVGGHPDRRFRRTHVLRSRHTDTAAYVRSAIANGTMQPALDALNTIQATGWCINTKVLEVIKWFHTNCVSVPGLPRAKDLELPKRTKAWEDMSDSERKAWKIRANKIKLRNRGFSAERVLLAEDLATAELLSGERVFYTPCNMDWRGRVYPLPHFNYQREDRVRSLFLFAKGEPMTDEGLYWLKVHVANTGDFEKLSKKPFADRVKWVNDNAHLIECVACDPCFSGREVWTKADKPFQFLAACVELYCASQAMALGEEYLTHLPISFDGSCSGLQHLSAMTRAKEGSFVNLTYAEKPQDIYQVVADRVESNIRALAARPDTTGTMLAACTLCLDYGITRSLVKRNVMTYGYSSQKFGMASQLVEDLMQPLALEVLAGERDHHPFGEDNGFTASRFLADQIFTAIEQVIKKPAEAMAFLRKLAKALAHENKPVIWTTPVGVPWINRYHDYLTQPVHLWLNDKGVVVRPHAVSAYAGMAKTINKTKAANGVAPNFVHALDASHLMMTVNACKAQGITDFALVHDSFGVHATRANTLRNTLREQFVRLYTEFDPLNDIRRTNMEQLTNTSNMPPVVEKGPLDIREILKAEYAFA